ncbi:MogA/MoaB family molybdenum cofactor biosynthesis protein [Marinococcus halotolerans]|uniref:MogA/MoaB family molybdenum cofactor biosynthesis protein n=1 Tax=Marinococcus halotolerans TaxID=301092 RepID=UPI0003B47DA6|nr:MogA/MoaB family molybdenum cofactor biosynthesis protein [Marinococcus halotolerans]
MATEEHKEQAEKKIQCAVITVSDTRTEETDKSGRRIHELLESHGHEVCFYSIVTDEEASITNCLNEALIHPQTEAVLINGGTGIADRDITIETIEPRFDKAIVGFGELFRYLSYVEDIGSSAILSRAAAGIIDHKPVFTMPGSSGAVKLAMEKLIVPELPHVVWEATKQRDL